MRRSIVISILMGAAYAYSSGATLASCFVDGTETALTPLVGATIEAASAQVAAGEPIQLKWHVPPETTDRDRFLIVGFPRNVRFGGEGFVAVTAGARAPHSLRTLVNGVRLVVPLGGENSNLDGSAKIKFFVGGEIKLPWTIVELRSDPGDKCTELVLQSGSLALQGSSGQPELVLQDRFATGSPKSSYVSSDRTLILSEFKDRYQVHDQATGDLLLDRPGTNPRFSPTGRFVTADLASGHTEIVDIRAQRVIYTSDDVDAGHFGGVSLIGWSDGDSIVIMSFSRQGTLAVGEALIDDRIVFASDIGCNGGCAGYGTTGLIFDLDRIGFTVANDLIDLPGNKIAMSLLEVADTPQNIAFWDQQVPSERTTPLPRRPHYPIAVFDRPLKLADKIALTADSNIDVNVDWDLSDRIAFTTPLNSANFDSKAFAALESHVQGPTAIEAPPLITNPAKGSIARRAFAVDGQAIAPRTMMGSLTANLAAFNIGLGSIDHGVHRIRRDEATADPEHPNLDLAQAVIAAVTKPNSPLKFREDLPKAQRAAAPIAKSYSFLPAGNNDDLPAPFISASALHSTWQFTYPGGVLILAQQSEWSGTAPDVYGDLVAVTNSQEPAKPPKFVSIAFSQSEAGAVDPSSGDTATQKLADTGAALDLGVLETTIIVSLANNRYLLVGSPAGGSIAVFEVPSMRRVALIKNISSALDLKDIALTADGKELIQINSSGDLYFYNLASGTAVLSGRLIDDELVLYDSTLRFEATPEGAAYVYVQVPGEPGLFSLDQFASRLETPGIGTARLRGVPSPNGAPSGLTPPSLSVRQQGEDYEATASSPFGVARLRVQVDGVIAREILQDGSQTNVSTLISTAEFSPAHWISFVAQDRNGLLSLTRAFSTPLSKYQGNLRVVSIGANVYSAAGVPDLTYAVGDAERFELAVKQSVAPAYHAYAGETITRSLSIENVENQISAAAQATKKEDTFILFIASHGLEGADGFSLALPATLPGGSPNLLPFRKIAEHLSEAKGRVFIFLDACHSGSATNDKAMEELVSSNANVVIIAASKGRQFSLEAKQWGGGAFTHAILDAFRSAKVNVATTGITLDRLYGSVKSEVVQLTDSKQTPWLRRVFWAGPQSLN
jgi:hypothetical protein